MKHLKLFFALFAMLALGVGNAWAEEATLSSISTKNVVSTKGGSVSTTFSGVTCTVTRNSGNQPGFYTSSGIVRYYDTDVMKLSVASGNVIKKIVFTMTSGTVGTADPTGLSSDSKTWTGSAESVSFTGSATVKISKIVVTYEASGSTTPDPEEPGTSGETMTYVFKDDSNCPGNDQTWFNGTIDEFSGWTATKGTNDPKYFTTGTGLRVYNGGKFTITSTKLMTSITLTFAGPTYTFSTSNTTNPQTVTPNAKSYEWSVSRTCRLQKIEITYAADAGGDEGGSTETAPSLTPDPASWDFGKITENTTATAKEFTISGLNLTSGDLTITAPEGYSVTPTTVAVSGATLESASIKVTPVTSKVGTFDGNLTITGCGLKSAVNVALKLTVEKAPATPTENVYVKVTSTAGITDGEYLIVYEDETAPVAFNGALATEKLDVASNNIEVSIASNTIAGNTDIDAATFTIKTTAGTIQTKDGYYIGQTSNANGLATSTTTEYTNTISIENDGSATIISSGGAYLRYNSANDNLRFRYFKSSTYTAQKAIALYKKVDPSEILAPAFSVAAGSYYDAQSVEITCATAGAEIYYTLDGSTPSSTSTKYTSAIAISETKTLKAIAIKGEYSSSVTEATYTILAPLATMQEIFDKATAVGGTATPVKVTMNNWVVTGVKNSNAYVTDGTKGLIIYKASHGFKVGDILSGTVACKVQLYDGSSELTELTSTTEGLTVSTGGTVTPVEVSDVTTLSGVNTGAVVEITGTCTQESSRYYVAGVQLYNSLFEFTNPTVGKKYNVTGVYLQYNTTQEILPRQQEDIEEIVDALPSATISIANITMEVGEEKTIEATITPVDAPITYETTATCITLNGTTITAVSEGTATITATIAGKAGEYTGVTKTFTVTVNAPNIATLPFAFDNGKADIENTPGMSQNGLGNDYGSAPLLKFDGTGDYVIIHFNGEPGKLSYGIKGNGYSGGTFTVQESEDGSAYTNIVEYTELGSTETKTHTLAATSRYVKFIYTNKSAGNVALGNIKIALPEEEPGEGGGETPEERLTDWVLTPLADITTNDLVVITMTKGETTWAMTNDKGTSAAPVASVVTLSADALAAEPEANLKWVVSNDNGTLTIYPYGTYETWLYCTNANNGVRVGTGEAKEFTIDTDHLYTTLTNEPRYLGVYDADADTWRCYTSINSNIEDQTLAFYVKKNANDVLPGTGEDPEGGEGGEEPVVPTPTINATATFVFNTAEGLNDLGITYPATADEDTEGAFKTEFENNATFTQDGITMTTTGGTVVATRVWLTKNGALDLRVYKGATLTFSVPAEHKISAIVFDGSNIGHLLVNETAVSGNAWTGSEQTVTFTAKADASTIKINTIAFVVEYTRDVTNKYGTICLPYGSTNYAGATFYQVVGKEEGKVYLESVTVLKAGVPYIFEKSASQIKVAYEGEAVDAPQNDDANGLVGTFEEIEVPNGMYILYNNAFCTNEPAGTLNKIRANRAYLNMNDVPGEFTKMPGRRYIGMSVQGENAETGLENIIVPEGQAVKVISNGQLIIIRDGEMYNAQGQKL